MTNLEKSLAMCLYLSVHNKNDKYDHEINWETGKIGLPHVISKILPFYDLFKKRKLELAFTTSLKFALIFKCGTFCQERTI